MTLAAIRARYRACKHRLSSRAKAIAAKHAKADARARMMIERAEAGETHQQIADSLGVTRCCVTQAISAYRKRHCDALSMGAR